MAAFMRGSNVQLTQDINLMTDNKAILTELSYSGIIISGKDDTGEIHTLTFSPIDRQTSPFKYGDKLTDKIVTFKDINIKNANFYGVFPQTKENNTTIRFDSVTYLGPQPVFNPHGQIEFAGNNDFTVNRHEVAEAKSITFNGGKTVLRHTVSSITFPVLFPYHYAGASIKVKNNANVVIEAGYNVFKDANAAYIDVSGNSTLHITARGIYTVKPTDAAITADDRSQIDVHLTKGIGATSSVVPLIANNSSAIRIKTQDNTYSTASNSDFTANNNSKIEIQSEKAISSGVMSGKVTATENSNINLRSSTQMFGTVSGNITATENSSISLNAVTKVFATFSSAEIRSGAKSDALVQNRRMQDKSSVTLASQQGVFGTLTGAQIKVEKDARMNISAQQFAENITEMQNTDLFTVAEKGTLTLKATDTLFKAIASSGTVRYKIDGILNQTVGQMYGGTLSRTFDYQFNAGSKVDMIFTSTSSKKNLQFGGDSTMTIGNGAKVVLSNSGNTAPIISGDNSAKNIITINRAHLELNRSKVDEKDSSHFEKVKMVLPDQCFRQIQTTDLLGSQQKYLYVNFEANQNGSTLTTTGNNDTFRDNFSNQLKQLIITDVERPVVTPAALEVHPDTTNFPVSGTATPGTELKVRFTGIDGRDLVADEEFLHTITKSNGEFSFFINFDKPFDVNFAIIVEANYSGEDKLERPVVVYVKQYEPADVNFKNVPDLFDFGAQPVTNTNKDIQPLVKGKKFEIRDNRKLVDRTNVLIMVKQTQPFTSVTSKHKLKNALWKREFKNFEGKVEPETEGEFLITDSDNVFMNIEPQTDELITERDLTFYLTGGTNSEKTVPGMIQANFSGEQKVIGEKYEAELEWTLLNAPPND
ncbi:hypothetical protein [Lacticaseibacillus saniviri]|nr:hypothetical protein [Lacticaseibacillus saniviri]